MNEIIIKELNEERKELEIDTQTFSRMLALVEMYGKDHPEISQEELGMITREMINSYDYPAPTKNINETEKKDLEAIYRKKKSINQCFKMALINLGYESRYERKFY